MEIEKLGQKLSKRHNNEVYIYIYLKQKKKKNYKTRQLIGGNESLAKFESILNNIVESTTGAQPQSISRYSQQRHFAFRD